MLPLALRLLLGAIAGVLLLYGVALLAVPVQAATWWPWPLSDLTARAIGAWLVGLGWAAAQGQLSGDRITGELFPVLFGGGNAKLIMTGDEILDAGVQDHLTIAGRPCNLLFSTLDHEGRSSQPFRTLFLQELIRWGVLAPSFIVSYSHDDDDIDYPVEAIRPEPRAAAQDWPRNYTDGCHADRPETASGECVYGNPDAARTVVLFGDSHAMQYFPALENIAKKRDWRLVPLTKSGCAPPDGRCGWS